MKRVQKVFNVLNFFVSLTVIGTVVWFHGYQYSPDRFQVEIVYLFTVMGFYFVQFVLRGIESGKFRDYLWENQLETLLFAAMIFNLLLEMFMGISLIRWLLSYSGIGNQNRLYLLVLHSWLLVIVGFELGRVATRSTIWKLSPPILFMLSFFVMVIIGSSLLMLPEMSVTGESLGFTDSLFTSVSANCVTGLTVVDTATFFSLKGKILILVLIQLGGLNIIFFATFFISRYHRALIPDKTHKTVKELMHASSLTGEYTVNLLKSVILTSFLIELVGAVLIYSEWGPETVFRTHFDKIFYSLFHSVSAFNNAGFSLFTDGFANEAVAGNLSLHISIGALIVMGGFGFNTIWDLGKFRVLFNRKAPPSPFRLGSQVAIVSSILLIMVGALIYYYVEADHSLAGANEKTRTVTAIFQSVTTRTAGFNTVDIGSLTTPVLIMMILWMFIGASSGGTGGGIKTSTVSVLLLAGIRRIFRKNPFEGTRLLTSFLVRKALAILLYSLLILMVGIGLLAVVEPEMPFLDLVFEEFSAFGTVGLSTGITPDLSPAGKMVVMVTMFIGRIGPLALAYTLVNHKQIEDDDVPGFMIG